MLLHFKYVNNKKVKIKVGLIEGFFAGTGKKNDESHRETMKEVIKVSFRAVKYLRAT